MDVQFNNLFTHFVFTVENRQPAIKDEYRERIEKYITGIINNAGEFLGFIFESNLQGIWAKTSCFQKLHCKL
jgi:REP element-mobilizing transposase RayT